MIHLCRRSPFHGYESAVVVGKGPSLDQASPITTPLAIFINETWQAPHRVTSENAWTIARDWPVLERIKALPRPWRLIVGGRAWRKTRWVQDAGALYFDDNRVIGPGTATAAFQLLGEAGVKTIHTIGLDYFHGRETIAYAESVTRLGLDPTDYARDWPAAGSPEHQRDRIKAAMDQVVERFGLDVREVV